MQTFALFSRIGFTTAWAAEYGPNGTSTRSALSWTGGAEIGLTSIFVSFQGETDALASVGLPPCRGRLAELDATRLAASRLPVSTVAVQPVRLST
ncbi:hypothetical protein GCM10009827_077230 [Dactylosporangium maewongense]|uniref:Uncharacterized protein n=1 Tax=Dactylosporangium maewongense TaxID=634393 RepID=A0ABN2BRE0_9ACTN